MIRKNTFAAPSPEEAGQLYEVAARLKELAPWTWMDESDIFGVQNPETGEIGFVSVMGMAGEHFAVALYQGAAALYDFWEMESGGALVNPMALLDVPQLQASFEDRDMLDKQDRDQIKKLGLKFRGAHAWPMFRSYAPGLMPWFVTATETRFLTCALARTLEVAPRVKDQPELLHIENDEGGERYLVCVPHEQGEGLVWTEQIMRVPAPEPEMIPVVLDMEVVGQLKAVPRRQLELEIDLLNLPMPMGERGERPYRPYMLMLADAGSGMVVGFELMKPDPSLIEMQGQIPMKLAEWLMEAGVVPALISVRSELLLGLLNPLANILNVRLGQSDSLPSLEAAMDSMFGMMGGDF